MVIRWRLLLAVGALCGPAGLLAQVCCPAGCVQNNSGCIPTGPAPTTSCRPIACGAPPGTPAPGHAGKGAPVVVFPMPAQPPHRPSCCIPSIRPGGSYSKTCRDYEMHCDERNEMLATCKDRRGRDVRTALPTVSSCLQVENENGQMKCRKRTKRPPAECI